MLRPYLSSNSRDFGTQGATVGTETNGSPRFFCPAQEYVFGVHFIDYSSLKTVEVCGRHDVNK